MDRNVIRLLCIALTVALVLSSGVGCHKEKPPVAAIQTPEPTPEPTEVYQYTPVIPATPEPEPEPVITEETIKEFQKAGVVKVIHFEFDRYSLTSKARDILFQNAQWLKDHPAVSVTIEGHCDERGSNAYNMALGAKRAQAAKDYLVALGVEEDRINTISWGEERPVDPGHNGAAWARNRRCEFVLGLMDQDY